jgi:hypothetical protein
VADDHGLDGFLEIVVEMGVFVLWHWTVCVSCVEMRAVV